MLLMQNCSKKGSNNDAGAPPPATGQDVLTLVSSANSGLNLSEGESKTYTLKLSMAPAANLTVNLASGNNAKMTVSPASINITTANWNNPQTITVTALEDDDAQNEAVFATATSAGLPTLQITVSITDNDSLKIVPQASYVNVNEGSAVNIGVKLGAKPAADVIVNTSSANSSALAVSPATLTFTPANWNVSQNITVTAPQDSNSISENPDIILYSASLPSVTLQGQAIDNDSLTIVREIPQATVNEGNSVNVGVKLSIQPAADVVVNVSSFDSNVAIVSPSTLTFTTANWNTYQNVTISGVEDNGDAVSESTQIFLSAVSLPTQAILVSVPDNDVLGIEIGTVAADLFEGQNGSVQVRLKSAPAANVLVTASVTDPTLGTVTSNKIFTPANWNTFQTFTVTSVTDPNTISGSTDIKFSSAGMVTMSVPLNVYEWIETDLASLTVKAGYYGLIYVRANSTPTLPFAQFVGTASWPNAQLAPTPIYQIGAYHQMTFLAPVTPGTYSVNFKVEGYNNGWVNIWTGGAMTINVVP